MTEEQARSLIQQVLNEHSALLWKDVLLASLESPVVILLLLLFIAFLFRGQISKLFINRNIDIGWGDKHIKLSELSNNLDKELDPIREELELLKAEFEKLRAGTGEEPEAQKDDQDLTDELVKKKIYKALSSPRFRWRSLKSLSKLSGISEDAVLEHLESDSQIDVGRAKDGSAIAKFKHR